MWPGYWHMGCISDRRAWAAPRVNVVSELAAFTNPDYLVLEGLHALKHALRFGGRIQLAVTADPDRLETLIADICPDLGADLSALVHTISEADFARLAAPGRRPGSPVLSLAEPPVLPVPKTGVNVVLYQVRHAGNAGAAIRVAAAAHAASVTFIGELDPWSPPVLRAAAGLHYAIPVRQAPWPLGGRPVIALDPDATEELETLPTDAHLVFGGERHGLPDEVLQGADRVLRIPMRTGVSSLNLAVSVGIALYAPRR